MEIAISRSEHQNETGREKTYPPLSELAGTLVLGVAEQLDHAALIRSKAGRDWSVSDGCRGREWMFRVITMVMDIPGNLTNDVPDERGALGKTTLSSRDTGLGGKRGDNLDKERRGVNIGISLVVWD